MIPTIDSIELWIGWRLPDAYRSFLANTVNSFLADNDRTLVYGRVEIIERNETFQSKEYCAGNLMIGDDGGGAAIVLSLTDARIHCVDMGAMTTDCFEPLSQSFEEWKAAGFPYSGN